MQRGRDNSFSDVFLPDAVNQQHPLNQQRVSWFLAMPPITGGAAIYDLMFPLRLPKAGAPTWVGSTRPGGAVSARCSVSSAGWSMTAPSRVRLTLPISLALWARPLGTTVQFASLGGVTYDDSDGGSGGPPVSYTWDIQTGSKVYAFAFNSAGTYTEIDTATVANTAGGWKRLLAVVTATGTSLYINGLQVYTDATAYGDPGYDATALLFMGNKPSVARNTNCDLDDMTIWSRGLSAAEAEEEYTQSRLGYPDMLNRLSPTAYSIPAASASTVPAPAVIQPKDAAPIAAAPDVVLLPRPQGMGVRSTLPRAPLSPRENLDPTPYAGGVIMLPQPQGMGVASTVPRLPLSPRENLDPTPYAGGVVLLPRPQGMGVTSTLPRAPVSPRENLDPTPYAGGAIMLPQPQGMGVTSTLPRWPLSPAVVIDAAPYAGGVEFVGGPLRQVTVVTTRRPPAILYGTGEAAADASIGRQFVGGPLQGVTVVTTRRPPAVLYGLADPLADAFSIGVQFSGSLPRGVITPIVPGSRGDGLRLQFGGIDVVSMRVIGDAIAGVIVTAAAARNGVGNGRLHAVGNVLSWQAPGSATAGTPVACTVDGVYLLEDGEDLSKWIKAAVYNDFLPATGDGLVFITDRYNELGPNDVSAAQAAAGLVQTVVFTLQNASAAAALDVLLWLDATAEGFAELLISSDGVSFYAPTSATDPNVLRWSSIAAGASVTLWIRRTIAAAAAFDPAVLNELQYSWRGY